MSRLYMNNRWCVRCGRQGPTPYLKAQEPRLWSMVKGSRVLDLGCGNGRNMKFLASLCTPATGGREWSCSGIDMAKSCPGSGCTCYEGVLGASSFPMGDKTVNLFLANYSLMFLNDKELRGVVREIARTSDNKALLMVELYPAKDSQCKDDQECEVLRDRIPGMLARQGLTVVIVHKVKNRMILQLVRD